MAANKLNYITEDSKSVILGSGELYAIKHTSGMNYATITTATMTDLGYIEANAKLSAKVDKKTVEAANAGDVFQFDGKKTVEFSTGIIEWNLKNIADFMTGSTYAVDETTGKKTFYYGDSDKSPNVFLRFVSEDEVAKKRITVDIYKCNFMGELAFDFNNDKPVTMDYSFKVLSTVMPNSKQGYFLVTEEDIV